MKNAVHLYATLLMFLILSCSVYCHADIAVTVYCDDNYPPFSYMDAGKVRGVYVEIMSRAFSRMQGYSVSIKAVPWKRGMYYLEQGKGFAIFPPYYRPNERPYIWPYSEPILVEEVVVICREEILKRIKGDNWPEDYYGLIIGNSAGFKIGGDKFINAIANGKITIDESRGNRENIMKLGLKRIDCYINDRLSILWELKQLKREGLYDEEGKHSKLQEGAVISSECGYLGFAKKDKDKFPFKEDFVKKFNGEIRKMKERGEIQKIVDFFMK